MSSYQNVLLPKRPVTEMSVTKMSITKVSFTKMSRIPGGHQVDIWLTSKKRSIYTVGDTGDGGHYIYVLVSYLCRRNNNKNTTFRSFIDGFSCDNLLNTLGGCHTVWCHTLYL